MNAFYMVFTNNSGALIGSFERLKQGMIHFGIQPSIDGHIHCEIQLSCRQLGHLDEWGSFLFKDQLTKRVR